MVEHTKCYDDVIFRGGCYLCALDVRILRILQQ